MAGKRPAYVVAEVEITDAAVFQEYVSKAVPTLAPANGRIIARNKPHSKEGTAPVGEIVIVAFESLEALRPLGMEQRGHHDGDDLEVHGIGVHRGAAMLSRRHRPQRLWLAAQRAVWRR